MSKETALDRYTRLISRRDQHIQDFKSIFDAHEKIVGDLIEADGDLRDEVAASGSGVSNTEFTVSLVPQTQTYADIEVIDALVADNKISKEFRDAIVKTVDRPAKISIKKN